MTFHKKPPKHLKENKEALNYNFNITTILINLNFQFK